MVYLLLYFIFLSYAAHFNHRDCVANPRKAHLWNQFGLSNLQMVKDDRKLLFLQEYLLFALNYTPVTRIERKITLF